MQVQSPPLLEIRNLTTVFAQKRGVVHAVTGLDLTLQRGEIFGLVGESGCGKSVSMLSILRLVAYPGRYAAGEILFEGRDLLKLSPDAIRQVRGKDIAMVFQDPMSTLNPVFPIGEQIAESLRIHGIVGRTKNRLPKFLARAQGHAEHRRVLGTLQDVGIPLPMEAARRYPHEYSGGMQQRALIAIALACEPKILLADEPTTALDVTVQAQIIELLRRINQEHGTAIILVTHNLGLASEYCQRLGVMYAGRMVEVGLTDQVIETAAHPYTQGLLACIPRVKERAPIRPIPGEVPDLRQLPAGCAFHPRCPVAQEACLDGPIPWVQLGPHHRARCIKYVDYRRDSNWSWQDVIGAQSEKKPNPLG